MISEAAGDLAGQFQRMGDGTDRSLRGFPSMCECFSVDHLETGDTDPASCRGNVRHPDAFAPLVSGNPGQGMELLDRLSSESYTTSPITAWISKAQCKAMIPPSRALGASLAVCSHRIYFSWRFSDDYSPLSPWAQRLNLQKERCRRSVYAQ